MYVNNEWKRRYFIRDSNATECVNILAKKRWLAKYRDSEKMDIRNYPAIKEMVLALKSAEPEKVLFHENKAIALLQKELSEMRGGAKGHIQVQMKNSALGEIATLL